MKLCILALSATAFLWAQDDKADRAGAQSRADEIDQARRQKSADLQPEKPSSVEHALQVIENDRILQRIFGGVNGWRLRVGGLATYSGFALGPEYDRRFWNGQARFNAGVRGSTRRSYLMETGLEVHPGDHAFFDIYGQHFDFPRMEYYGPGPNSSKSARSVFLLENTAFAGQAGVKFLHHFRIGAVERFLMVNVGPGRDSEFANAAQSFTEQTTPGIQYQSNFLQSGGFAQFDWRDNGGYPRAGGNYAAEFSEFEDVRRSSYGFDRLTIEAQQYIPLFDKRRVIALRSRIIATDPHAGNQVPFYLQPTLGGPDDLRGYRAYRFYGNTSAVLNGEYRWEVFQGLDMAIFADAGRVFDDWRQIDFRQFRTSYGFGFRFHTESAMILRLETGFSQEGFGIWLKFDNVF